MKNLLLFASIAFAINAFGYNQPVTRPDLIAPITRIQISTTTPEWEDPIATRINAEPARTNAAIPKGDDTLSLNGKWKFNWVKSPELRPKDFYKLDYNVSNWKSIQVPSSWQIQGYGTPHYSNVDFPFKVNPPYVMGEPPKHFTAYNERNPVGSYRRTFKIPSDWKNQPVFVRFDGAEAGYYVWVNGKFVGYSEDSYTAAEFNITDLLHTGENVIAVEVYRFTDGSYLECQDFFRHSGIFRDVTLFTTEPVAISDFFVKPTLTSDYKKGLLSGEITISNYGSTSSESEELEIKLAIDNKFFSDPKLRIKEKCKVYVPSIPAGGKTTVHFDFARPLNIQSWSAETPNLYEFEIESENADDVKTKIGFRKVEVGPNGEILVNGRETIFKGVNVHESHPDMGRAITRDVIEKDIQIMKKNNVNTLRCAHYPHQRHWYDLADKYGIYVMDEANCEAHGSRGSKHDISRIPSFEKAHVERNMNMVHRTKNNTSVIFWSLGNESGNGPNFDAASRAIRQYDNTRLLHYCEYGHGDKNVDMDSTMYPPVSAVETWGQQVKNKRPFFVCEYAHSMGNALGNFKEYQDAFEKHKRMVGGCIWDWVDQNIRAECKPDGKYKAAPYTGNALGYGGMFGDAPTQNNFCDNGIITSDRKETPKTKEMAHVFQYVTIKELDREAGKFRLINKYFHKSIENFKLEITNIDNPKEKLLIDIPETKSNAFWDFNVPLSLAAAPLLFEVINNDENVEAYDSFKASTAYNNAQDAAYKAPVLNGKTIKVQYPVNGGIELTADKVVYTFDKNYQLAQMNINGKNMMKAPLSFNMFRAPVDNDAWIRGTWYNNKMHEINAEYVGEPIKDIKENQGAISFKANYQTNSSGVVYHYTTIWTLFANGELHCDNVFYPQSPEICIPRLGFAMQIDANYDNITYYGNGPWENYSDRKTASWLGKHSVKVNDMLTQYSRPQAGGNRTDVQYIQMLNNDKQGFTVMSESKLSPLNTTAIYWTELEMDRAKYIDRLPAKDKIVLSIDAFQCGLGGSSCGPRPLAHYTTYNAPTSLAFVIAPDIKTQNDKFCVSAQPLITRDNDLNVSITSATPKAKYQYKINDGAFINYEKPFKLISGTIYAQAIVENSPQALAPSAGKVTFDAVAPRSAWKVVSASSEEPTDGFAQNAIDNNPKTYWHTAYKNALPNYPHNIVIDMGLATSFSGFTYTPRTDEKNGLVEKYAFFISDDGKTWNKVNAGSFSYHYIRKDPLPQRIDFGKTVKARYFKFEAISPVFSNHPWANCAEISIIPVQ